AAGPTEGRRRSFRHRNVMRWLIAVAGAVWIAVIVWDAFEAIVLPRRVTRRLRPSSTFYRITWTVWSAIARRLPQGGRRETYLSFYAPRPLPGVLAPRDRDHAAGRARGLAAERGGAVPESCGRGPRGVGRAARRLGALGSGDHGVAPVLSGAVVLPLAARQPVVARRAHDHPRHERPGDGGRRRRLCAAGGIHVRHGPPRGGGPRAGPAPATAAGGAR